MLVTVAATLPVALFTGMAVQVTRSFHVAAASVGLVATMYYLGAAASSVPSGRAVERIGGARFMRLSALLVAALLVACGLLARSETELAVLLVFGGVVGAGASPATNLFLARRVDGATQGTAFGVKQAAVPLAQVVGGLAVPIVALTVGWRWAFVSGAGLALLAATSVPPSRVSMAERRQARHDTPRPTLARGPLLCYAAGIGFAMFASSGLTAFSVVAATSTGFSRSAAGVVAAAGGACAVIGRIVIGRRADRRSRPPGQLVVAMLVGGAAGFAVMMAAAASSSRWLFVAGIALALGLGWGCNGLFNYMIVDRYRHAPAAATGVTGVGARIGGVLGPITVGLLVGTSSSYTAGWAVAMLASLLAAVSIVAAEHLRSASGELPPWAGAPAPRRWWRGRGSGPASEGDESIEGRPCA